MSALWLHPPALKNATAAICLIGLPRMLDSPKWWSYRREFLRSLTFGGTEVELLLVTDVMYFDAMYYRQLISEVFVVPMHSVHAFNMNESRSEAAAKRCHTKGAPCPHSGDAAATFYAQADKARECYDHVLALESKRARSFDFVIRMRVDWLFESGPALISLRDTNLIYARLRCYAMVGSAKMLLPPSYMSFNSPERSSEVGSGHHGCGAPSKFIDDAFVIAPRKIADALFHANSLPCPHEDVDVLRMVKQKCANRAWPECYLQIALHRAKQAHVGPIPITWHFPGWHVMEQDCEGLRCSWNSQNRNRQFQARNG